MKLIGYDCFQDFNNWDPRETRLPYRALSLYWELQNLSSKRDDHNAVFTNSFQSLKETINNAGWVILL